MDEGCARRVLEGVGDVEGLRVPGSPVLEGEEDDPYARQYELPEGFGLNFFGKKYYHLPEVDEGPLDEMRAVNFRVKEDEFMEVVCSCKSSPVATLQVLMADAVLQNRRSHAITWGFAALLLAKP